MSSIKKLSEGVYCKIIPLRGNPLKSINIYMVKSKGEAMIVDTGFNTEEIRNEMLSFIKEMDVDMSLWVGGIPPVFKQTIPDVRPERVSNSKPFSFIKSASSDPLPKT